MRQITESEISKHNIVAIDKSIIDFYGVFQETILGIMVEDIKNEDEKYEWT